MNHGTWSQTCAAILFILLPAPHCFSGEFPDPILQQLASGDFKTREKAEEELTEWAASDRETAYDQLYRHAREHPEAEVRVRCLSTLRRLVSEIYDSEGQGYVGIRMNDEIMRLPEQETDVAVLRVVEVVPDSPAAKSGIVVGDFVVSLEQAGWKQLPASKDFQIRIKAYKPRSVVTLQVLRDGKQQDVQVRLARRPAAADNIFELPDLEKMQAEEEALRDEHFKKWLLDRKNGR